MLFNSYIFIFVFIPIVLLGVVITSKLTQKKFVIAWLIFSSLFFYGWWNPIYIFLLVFSILINYSIGQILSNYKKRLFLILGISFNVLLLGYFKYANFFVDNINFIFGEDLFIERIILPLAISFFTFQQIIYLIDSFKGETKSYKLLNYFLFVTFFPQLIAGPIVNHKDVMPQISNKKFGKLNYYNLVVGSTIFFVGLFKKVVIADSLALYATPIFDASEIGIQITFLESWVGALAYTFQLYFDFSGYSDMALGLARLFGITLPINFYSPFKSTNIADFWRRWHITLSNFIKNYLFYPLAIVLTRYAIINKYKKFMTFIVTVVFPMAFAWGLAGLWHGAAWKFVIFGLMHGAYLTTYQLWTDIRTSIGLSTVKFSLIRNFLSRVVTFMSVLISFVIFRADSIESAISMYKSMFGFRGFSLPMALKPLFDRVGELPEILGVNFQGAFYNGLLSSNPLNAVLIIFLAFLLALFTPNVAQWLRSEKPALGLEGFANDKGNSNTFSWKMNSFFLVITALIAVISIMFLQKESEFLYFQF